MGRKKLFLTGEEDGVQTSGDNVVKGVGARGNTKTAQGKEHGKINACQGPKTKSRAAKGNDLTNVAFPILFVNVITLQFVN